MTAANQTGRWPEGANAQKESPRGQGGGGTADQLDKSKCEQERLPTQGRASAEVVIEAFGSLSLGSGQADATVKPAVQFTKLTYRTPIGKHLARDESGKLVKSILGQGYEATATAIAVTSIEELEAAVRAATPYDVFVGGLPAVSGVRLTTKASRGPGTIARTKCDLPFRAVPGVMFIDNDHPVGEADDQFWVYCQAASALARASYVYAPSSSAWIIDSTTGERLKGAGGQHCAVPVLDATDIPRAIKALHERAVLAGFGKAVVTSSGQIHIKSPVDLAMASSNQPLFQRVTLGDGLAQAKKEHIGSHAGEVFLFDTREIEDLNDEERRQYDEKVRALRAAKEPEASRIREAWAAARAPGIAERTGKPVAHVAEALKACVAGTSGYCDLIPGMKLLFEQGEVDVAVVRADPARFDGLHCADPLEPEYGSGIGVAKFYANAGAKLVVNSHAHGGMKYFLHPDLSDLDLSGILGQRPALSTYAQVGMPGSSEGAAPDREPENLPADSPGNPDRSTSTADGSMGGGIPTFITNPPGMIGTISRWILETAPKAQPELATAAAIALCAAVTQRIYRSDQGNLTSLYIVLVAKSGEGKEHPQACVSLVLEAAGLQALIAGSGYTSAGAVHSALLAQPSHIAIIDEFGKLLKHTRAKGNAHSEAAIDKLVEAFGRLSGVIRPAAYSSMTLPSSQAAAMQAVDRAVHYPAITLLGATTPATFYESLTDDLVGDGFLGRLLVVRSSLPRQLARTTMRTETPHEIVNWCKTVHAPPERQGNLAGIAPATLAPVLVEMRFRADCRVLLDDLERRLLELKDQQEPHGLDILLGRTREKAMRLAMVAALAEDPLGREIRPEHVRWAIDYVMHYDLRLLTDVRQHRVRTEDGRQIRKLVDMVSGARKMASQYSGPMGKALQAGYMPRQILLRNMHIKARELDELITTAHAAGEIEVCQASEVGLEFRGAVLWRAQT